MYLRVLFSEVMLKDISLAMHKEINDTKNRPKKNTGSHYLPQLKHNYTSAMLRDDPLLQRTPGLQFQCRGFITGNCRNLFSRNRTFSENEKYSVTGALTSFTCLCW